LQLLFIKRVTLVTTIGSKHSISQKKSPRLFVSFVQYKWLYLMFLPVLLYYIIFKYAPMFGLIIAFKDYNLFEGIVQSPWVGFKHFTNFFHSMYFGRVVRNTIGISLLDILVNFPAPIILALLLNEVTQVKFKRTVQTISYLPHFISTVIIAGMLVGFLSPSTGLINNIIVLFGGEPIYFLAEAKYFWGIFTLMNMWKSIGWGSIIYLATLLNIDPTLYEASVVDGAGRLRQAWHITLPGIMPTIVVLLIMKIGNLLEVSYESIILLYNSQLYETADVISTFVYRRGLIDADYSFASAVGLLQSVLAMILVIAANKFSKSVSDNSLW